MDYMYMTKKPTELEIAHPTLFIKGSISGGVWSLPVTRKGPMKKNGKPTRKALALRKWKC